MWKRWDKYWDMEDRTFLIWNGGYMIFDTHAHYDDEQFNEDRVELLNSMEEQGVGTIVNVSAAYNSCRKVIALAKEYPFVYAAVGILVSILSQVLKHSGREEQAFLTSLAGLILVLSWVLPAIYDLFSSIRQLFSL